jgi:hypothetical protein
MVNNRHRSEARNQLVSKPHALSRTERVSGAESVEFGERLLVRIGGPFGRGEEGAEGGEGCGGGGDGVEGAEVH